MRKTDAVYDKCLVLELDTSESAYSRQFKLFSKLPLELRYRIIHLIFPPRRSVNLSKGKVRYGKEMGWGCVSSDVTCDEWNVWSSTGKKKTSLPIGLYVNSEFRQETLRYYKVVLDDQMVFGYGDERSDNDESAEIASVNNSFYRSIKTLSFFSPKRDNFYLQESPYDYDDPEEKQDFFSTSRRNYLGNLLLRNPSLFSNITELTLLDRDDLELDDDPWNMEPDMADPDSHKRTIKFQPLEGFTSLKRLVLTTITLHDPPVNEAPKEQAEFGINLEDKQKNGMIKLGQTLHSMFVRRHEENTALAVPEILLCQCLVIFESDQEERFIFGKDAMPVHQLVMTIPEQKCYPPIMKEIAR